MGHSSLNTKDKNNILMAVVLVAMIALAAVFFNLSRALPMLYMAIAIEAFEILYVIPKVCDDYYKLYGMSAGTTKWIPYYNVFAIFSKPIAIACIVMPIITFVFGYLSVGPMFWVTLSNISTFTDLQSRALGWFIVSCLAWSIVVGAGYISIIKSVNSMKAEFYQSYVSKAEFTNYALVLFPIARCFVLFNLVNSMQVLISSGYENGKDYSTLEIEEGENYDE